MSSNEERRQETGRRIRQLRQVKELTTAKLAEDADISAGYLSEVERGLSEISVEKLQRIANALHVELQSLVGDVPPETKNQSNEIIPRHLADAATDLNLSYQDTVKLLRGQQSLVARRSSKKDAEWSKEKWVEFYHKVKQFLMD